MLRLAGPGSQVHFTNLSTSSCAFINRSFDEKASKCGTDSEQAEGKCHTESVMDLLKLAGLGQTVDLSEVCLLDPKAEKELTPEDGDGRFKCFLFGGILGDDPPRDRTSELRVLGFPGRRLGPVQMTTDTALGVTKIVVKDGVKLEDIPYVEFPTITFNANESVEMPFRRSPFGMFTQRRSCHAYLSRLHRTRRPTPPASRDERTTL
jgi:ribosome biogenesis SPOUT family RNA methylase Rps3